MSHAEAAPLLAVVVGTLFAACVAMLARLDRATLAVRAAERGMRDSQTGLLTAAGFELAVANELEWADREGVTMALVVYDVEALEWRTAVARGRERIRGHEHAGLLGERRFGVLLWGADEQGVQVAAARLGAPLLGDDTLRVSVGWALAVPGSGLGFADLVERVGTPSRSLRTLVDAAVSRDAGAARAA